LIELLLRAVERGAGLELLSADERERAARFRFDADRDAYASARSALRRELGARLRVDPRALVFGYEPNGKPYVDGAPHFNVSHTREAFAIAICADAPVGVDVELARPERASLAAALVPRD
jgi:4'-phosphopantetheinyl transferase